MFKFPLSRISRPFFILSLSHVPRYTPSGQNEKRLGICDPIGNIFY